jgi:hypothetical protein
MLHKKMKHTEQLIHSIEPLLRVSVAQADRHGLEEIRISTARARELLHLATICSKEIQTPVESEPAYFARLDKTMRAMEEAIWK